MIDEYKKSKQGSVNNQSLHLRDAINTESKTLPMSSNGTVLEITERQSGPETPPRTPTAHALKRES